MSFECFWSWFVIFIESTAVHKSVKRRLGELVTACDAQTSARLAHQLPHGMQEVDVVARQVMDPLERGQGWPLQAVVANQAAHNRPVFLLHVTGVILEIGPRAGECDALVGAIVQQGAD